MESAHMNYWRSLGLDQKRAYQPNMLKSILLVNGGLCIAILTCMILLKLMADKTTLQIDVVSVSDTPEIGVSGEPSKGKSAGSSKGSMVLFTDKFLSGYMPNIKIVRDHPQPIIPIQPSVSSDVHKPIIELTSSGFDPYSFNEEDNVYGLGDEDKYGGGDDFGLPPSEPYMPKVRWSPSLNIDSISKPAWIILVDLRWPVTVPKTDTGYVVIIIDIDTKGRIEWEVIEELPAGQGFANALIEALKRSTFNPPVNEYGEKMPIRAMLTSTICYGCSAQIKTIKGTVKALQLHRN